MMTVKIKGTCEVKELSWKDIESGVEVIEDMVGNHGGFGSSDSQFQRNEDFTYTATQETFDWWNKVASDGELLDSRILELKEEFGSNAVRDIIESAGDHELEFFAGAVNAALDEAFGEDCNKV